MEITRYCKKTVMDFFYLLSFAVFFTLDHQNNYTPGSEHKNNNNLIPKEQKNTCRKYTPKYISE